MPGCRVLLAMAAVALSCAPASIGSSAGARVERPAARSSRAPEPPRAVAPARSPLLFIENRGQVDPRVSHYLCGRGATVYFTSEGLTWALSAGGRRWAVKQDFVGARADARPGARDRRETVFSWFKGPRARWRTGVPTFGTLAWAGLWPGIDMVCAAGKDRLKTLFRVSPGADPGRIRFAYRGATSVTVTPAGSLRVETPVGGFEDGAPVAWQERDGLRAEVDSAYEIEERGGGDGAVACGFRVGDFDPALPLLVDPSVALYAGLVGGSGDDSAAGVALDAEGNAYIAGTTDSTAATFPVAAGPDLALNASPPDIYGHHDKDAFVAKVRADGTGLVYCGYLGGDSDDEARGIAVDAAGNAYVAGSTSSAETTFPATVGPDITFNGSEDAFVAKVRADGTGLVYCGFVGGSQDDSADGIAVDAAGNAYLTGSTPSGDGTFPVTVGPDLTFNGGLDDAFVAKVKADGTGLEYCGYIGGSEEDEACAIAVDSAGNAFVAGSTFSNEATFPVAVGPDLEFSEDGDPYDLINGGSEAFVARVRADGTGLAYCGFIGGQGDETAHAIAVDASGRAYATGSTSSSEDSFPVAVGPDLTFGDSAEYSGSDAFVARVRADGTGLDYCGYIGGSGSDRGLAIAVDTEGNAIVTGVTGSTEATFPVKGGPGLVSTGGQVHGPGSVWTTDAFVARVAADGSGLNSCGFLAGMVYDGSFGKAGLGIAVDAAGSACIAGCTYPDETTFPVTVGPGLTAGGGVDAFVTRIPSGFPPSPRSLRLRLARGEIYRTMRPWEDRLSVSGSFEVEGAPFPGGMDPRSGGLVFEVAAPVTTGRIVIPAGDPGWRKSASGVFTWRSPARSFPSWRVRIDTERGTFAVRGSRGSLGFEWRTPVTVFLSADGASGSDSRLWQRTRNWWHHLHLPRGSGE